MIFKKNKKTARKHADGGGLGKRSFTYYSSDRRLPQRSSSSGLAKFFSKRGRGGSEKLVLAFALLIVASISYMLYLEPVPRVILEDDFVSDQPHLIQRDKEEYRHGIEALLNGSVLNRSKLTFQNSKINHDFSRQYPEVKELRISLPIVGKRPVFKLSFSRGAYILANPNQTVVLDSGGKALIPLSMASGEQINNLPVITDEANTGYQLGSQVLSKQSLGFVNNITQQFAHAEVEIERLVLPTVANELHVYPKREGHYVKFAFDGDPRLQAGNYFAFREHAELSGKRIGLYVDVRVSGKVYYK